MGSWMWYRFVVILKLIYEVMKNWLENWGRNYEGWFCYISCKIVRNDRDDFVLSNIIMIMVKDYVYKYKLRYGLIGYNVVYICICDLYLK